MNHMFSLAARGGARPPFDLRKWLDTIDFGEYEDNFRNEGYDRLNAVCDGECTLTGRL